MLKFKREKNQKRFEKIKKFIATDFDNRWKQYKKGLITYNELAFFLNKAVEKEKRIVLKMVLSEK